MDNYVAFIPARGGSKSIPLKNIKPMAGKPLIHWTIRAALDCSKIGKVYLSSDSNEIRAVAEQIKDPRLEVIDRDPSTATDTATTESAMLDFLSNRDFDNIILIQATSPLLTSRQLTEAIEIYEKEDVNSLISVVRQKRFIWKIHTQSHIAPVNYNPLRRPRRQDFEGFLVENGAISITNHTSLKLTECRVSGNTACYEMPESSYTEIDEPSDWIIVENLLIKQQFNNIKLLITDVDGVLTDAGMYYTDKGDELKKFHTRDGMAIKLLHEAGIPTAIITGENTEIVKRRAVKLGILDVYQDCTKKIKALEALRNKYNLHYSEIAYVGDDILDIPVLKKVGLPICPADSMPAVKEVCTMVTKANGGEGVIREIFEMWSTEYESGNFIQLINGE